MASSPLFSIASAIPNEGIVRPMLRRNHTTNIRANAANRNPAREV
jgi:hypothetical protein